MVATTNGIATGWDEEVLMETTDDEMLTPPSNEQLDVGAELEDGVFVEVLGVGCGDGTLVLATCSLSLVFGTTLRICSILEV